MLRAAYLPNLVETQKAFQKSKQILMNSNEPFRPPGAGGV
jgi:hypothetical protein